MLFLKKNCFINNYKNLYYFFQFYKIKSYFLRSTLKKKEIWLWPILILKISKLNIYNSLY